MSAQRRPIGTIAFAGAFLASSLALGVPANIAFAVDCLTAPNSPAPANSHWHYRTAQDRKCWHLQTDNHPFRTGSRAGCARSASQTIAICCGEWSRFGL